MAKFKNNAPGCCCSPTSCATVTVTLKTCNGSANIVGGTVTITQGGSTYGPCTTNGSGQCTIGLPSSGSYTITGSASGYLDTTSALSFTCVNVSRSISMSQCDLTLYYPTPGTVTLTIGGTSYTLTGFTPGGGLIQFASPTPLSYSSLKFLQIPPAPCAQIAGNPDFAPTFTCSNLGASHFCPQFTYTFWASGCSPPATVGQTASSGVSDEPSVGSVLTSYTNSPLNAVFALNSVTVGTPGYNSIVPFSGNAVITP